MISVLFFEVICVFHYLGKGMANSLDHPLSFNHTLANDINVSKEILETIDQKRWKVEGFHKSIKSNTGGGNHWLERKAIIFSCRSMRQPD